MKAFARLLDRTSALVDRACRIAAAVVFILMIALVTLQVVARYGFSSPPSWTEEAARYAMIWFALLGGTVAFRAKRDPVIVPFNPHWPRLVARFATFGRSLTALVFVGPLVWFGVDFVARYSHRISDTIGVNMGLVVAIIPLFGGIVALHAVADLFYPRSPEADPVETEDAVT